MMGGALVMILFNVFVPHLLATIILGRYAPGAVGFALVMLPLLLASFAPGRFVQAFV